MLYHVVVPQDILDTKPLLTFFDGAAMENSEGLGVLVACRGLDLLVVGTEAQLLMWLMHFEVVGLIPTEYQHNA